MLILKCPIIAFAYGATYLEIQTPVDHPIFSPFTCLLVPQTTWHNMAFVRWLRGTWHVMHVQEKWPHSNLNPGPPPDIPKYTIGALTTELPNPGSDAATLYIIFYCFNYKPSSHTPCKWSDKFQLCHVTSDTPVAHDLSWKILTMDDWDLHQIMSLKFKLSYVAEPICQSLPM